MTQIRTQFDLMRILANRLAGREVIVRLQEPATKGSLGAMSIGPDGIPVILISPSLGQWTIETLLHEIAHVRLHANQMTRSTSHQAPARSITVSQDQKRPAWEDQADQLRDQWLAWGKANRDPALPEEPGGPEFIPNTEPREEHRS